MQLAWEPVGSTGSGPHGLTRRGPSRNKLTHVTSARATLHRAIQRGQRVAQVSTTPHEQLRRGAHHRSFDVLIDHVKKERFGVGRKPRQPSAVAVQEETFSRHIPDAIKRKVYERDAGRCTFVDERGRRCPATGNLEFEHVDGFLLTHLQDEDRIRLMLERARSLRASTCSGPGRGASIEATRQLDLLGQPTR